MGDEGEGRTTASVLILGIDGYIGWPLAKHLKALGYEVSGIDSFIRRKRVLALESNSLVPISSVRERREKFDIDRKFITDLKELPEVDVIVHLAEQPSAPWSMRNVDYACTTQFENVIGTLNILWLMREFCPNAHLLKLGTMGEYGTPDCVIPEGFIEDGPMQGLPFPRVAGSFYHLSKVFDSQNIYFACKTWGLKSTDIMQGVVFGLMDDTRFDYDEYFGTVVNRFCAQAVAGIPLTIYGAGGQTRGYLPLRDSIECLTLAIKNPPQPGEYRVFNQFARPYSVEGIAFRVMDAGERLGIDVKSENIPNPRVEKEKHRYEPKHDHLRKLGYNPQWDFGEEIKAVMEKILPHKDRIEPKVIFPKTKWRP